MSCITENFTTQMNELPHFEFNVTQISDNLTPENKNQKIG